MIAQENSVLVEFYGVARLRAGVAHTRVELKSSPITLSELLQQLSTCYPDFGCDCVVFPNEGVVFPNEGQAKLGRSLTANLDGRRFVREGETEISTGQTLLIMSADAGG